MQWIVEFTDEADKEIKELPAKLQAKFLHVAELIEDFGPHKLSEKHVKHLRGKLWEMRLRGQQGIVRAIYFAVKGRKLIVVRAFIKKTEKTPQREIELAEQRMDQFNREHALSIKHIKKNNPGKRKRKP